MQSEWWRGAIIYQVYPRSFYDSNHDGTGDLSGIRAKLDYVASLGVDAIWISPFFKSPMRDFGYDVSDYRKVDPIFGSNADFKRAREGGARTWSQSNYRYGACAYFRSACVVPGEPTKPDEFKSGLVCVG